ncbi:Integrin alpha [Desmophyllum pertusum]|uniref:Integrin alpha n=1 Tax=Desmophyllum pertusum TaxID=174260 RepID=A0A9W9ZY35_9CNID|nr:Integrin alpha [Desmophyllum pertusum]
MMLLLVLSLCCIIEHSFGYNLETELPVIRRGDAGSYFGFSVASHSFEAFDTKQNQSWLLVGAPKANNTAVPQLANPGVVYKCDFSKDPQCLEVAFDTKGNRNGDQKDNSWFGVSVMSSGHDGYVMACSHRLLHVEGSFFTYPGRCIGAADLEGRFKRDIYDFCETKNQNKANAGGTDTINYKDHMYCQMGLSVSYLKSDRVPLIGAPGVYNYQGEFIYYSRDQKEVARNNSELGYQVVQEATELVSHTLY